MKFVSNIIALPQTFCAQTIDSVDILVHNEAYREEYCLFKMSNKPAGKGLSITSLSWLDSWIASYLEDIGRKSNWTHRGDHEAAVIRNRALKLPPVAMYNIQTEVSDHMKRQITPITAF